MSEEDQKRLEDADKITKVDSDGNEEDDMNSTFVARRSKRTIVKKEKVEEEVNQEKSGDKSFSSVKTWIDKNSRSEAEKKKALKSIEKNRKKNPRNESSIILQ